jgi:hypothetical protein
MVGGGRSSGKIIPALHVRTRHTRKYGAHTPISASRRAGALLRSMTRKVSMSIGSGDVGLNDWMPLAPREEGAATGRAAKANANAADQVSKAEGSESSSRVGRGSCKTCAERKYKDVSNDPSVSFQTPTSVAPGMEGAAVRSHEQEHVSHNAARAERDGMTATSTVVIHTAICPECGRPYVSGGTTTTTYSRSAALQRQDEGPGQLIDAVA